MFRKTLMSNRGKVNMDMSSVFLLPGTIMFSPRECLLGEEYFAEPATVWSVGVTLYDMVCGRLPFDSVIEIIRGRVNFPKTMSPGKEPHTSTRTHLSVSHFILEKLDWTLLIFTIPVLQSAVT